MSPVKKATPDATKKVIKTRSRELVPISDSTDTDELHPESAKLPVRLLDFDSENPRFPAEIARGSVETLLERFVRDERLLELVESIGGQGFFPGEPLLVVRNGTRFTVIEGNRRLAALKLLNQIVPPPEGRISIEEAVEAAKYRPAEVQCLIFEKGDQILRYLGFRHITGIKSWSALQKARYLYRLYSKYAALPVTDGLKKLAKETGSRADYMGQMLTALALYRKAESNNFYEMPLSPDDIDFSFLSTSLSYASIAEYVGVESRYDLEIPNVTDDKLSEMFRWLFVAQGNKKTIVGETRNLKRLAAVVKSTTAVKELNRTGSLDDAYELSKGPAQALTESLVFSQRRLSRALSLVPKVSDIDESHIEQAEEIESTANSLNDAIRSSKERRERKRVAVKRS